MNAAQSSRRLATALIAGVFITVASVVFAQRIWVGGGGFYREPPKWATPADFDGSFLYCRGFYRSVTREMGGQGWSTDYPGADNNFSVRLAELTRVHIRLNPDRQPNTVVVALSDPLLFRCPMLFMEDVGTANSARPKCRTSRPFSRRAAFSGSTTIGGVTRGRDGSVRFHASCRLGSFRSSICRSIIPACTRCTTSRAFLQVSSIQFWRQSGGDVSERGSDSQPVHYSGIQDSHGRLIVLMTHNTDVSDTWEREGENQDYFDRFSPAGYAIGVNIVLYVLTH